MVMMREYEKLTKISKINKNDLENYIVYDHFKTPNYRISADFITITARITNLLTVTQYTLIILDDSMSFTLSFQKLSIYLSTITKNVKLRPLTQFRFLFLFVILIANY